MVIGSAGGVDQPVEPETSGDDNRQTNIQILDEDKQSASGDTQMKDNTNEISSNKDETPPSNETIENVGSANSDKEPTEDKSWTKSSRNRFSRKAIKPKQTKQWSHEYPDGHV